LINLEDVEIENFKGGFREIDFLEASVFRCAPMTKVTVKLASKADKLLLRNWTFVPFAIRIWKQQSICAFTVFMPVRFGFLVAQWMNGKVIVPVANVSMQDWWNTSVSGLSKQDRRMWRLS
jgi:hypothetical protein